MAPPTVDQTRAAAEKVNTLSPADFQKRKSQEVGDALMGFFVILAKKLFPKDPETATVRRVQLMLASYFLRAELDARTVTAPDEAKAKKATDAVTSLSGAALDKRITEELGEPVLTYLRVFAERHMAESDPAALSAKVHLMVLAYLMRGVLAEA